MFKRNRILTMFLAFVVVAIFLFAFAAPAHAADGAPDATATVTVSVFSWILMHAVSIGSAILAGLVAVVTLWSGALQSAQRQEERLAVVEALARSAPPEILSVVDAVADKVIELGKLAASTGTLVKTLTDDKTDYSLKTGDAQGQFPPGPDPKGDQV